MIIFVIYYFGHEWQPGRTGSGKREDGLRQVDAVMVADLGFAQRGLHHTGVAAGDIAEAEGRLENVVQRLPEETAYFD